MSSKNHSSEQRKQRLAAALKANIGRRKAQARQREAGEAPGSGEAPEASQPSCEGTEPEHPPEEDGCRN
jgi:hypothetical protein